MSEVIPSTLSCARCGRTADQFSSGFVAWEVLDDGTQVCPDCVTPEEQQAVVEDVGP